MIPQIRNQLQNRQQSLNQGYQQSRQLSPEKNQLQQQQSNFRSTDIIPIFAIAVKNMVHVRILRTSTHYMLDTLPGKNGHCTCGLLAHYWCPVCNSLMVPTFKARHNRTVQHLNKVSFFIAIPVLFSC